MQRKGSLFGLASGLFWGLDSVFLGVVLATTLLSGMGMSASLVTTFIHDGISFFFLILLLIKMKDLKTFFKVLRSKAGLAIIAAAILGGPLGMGAYILSINYLGASLAASISAVYPAVGAVLAYVFLKERLRTHSKIGLGIAIIAISLMGFTADIEISNLSLGILFMGICIVGWGSEAVIINAALKEDVSSEVALGIRQFTSFVVYSLIVLPLIGFNTISTVMADPYIVSIVLISGVIGTLSYLCYYKSIDLIGATQAMGLNISYPAWAFFFQFIVDRQFDPVLFILVLFIIFGSILSNDQPKEMLKIFKKQEATT